MIVFQITAYLLAISLPFTHSETCSDSYGKYDQTSYTRNAKIVPNSWWKVVQKDTNLETRLSEGEECPKEYLRYSPDPTYCKNSACDVISEGVNEEDKTHILEMHNSLRSRLATGQESRYRQLPPAANMMEMEWDEELEKIAQAHASLCVFGHDKGEQRRVDEFPVGQNLLLSGTDKKDWNSVNGWYKEEVCFYFPEYNTLFTPAKEYGHFTQVAWAKTWKVGCGYASYREGGKKSLYTCNYGPSGNVVGSTFYIEGDPCSRCPLNTKCSTKYPGLCKSETEDGPQLQRPSAEGFILFCDFSKQDPEECKEVKVTGSREFSTKHIYTGDYKTVVLQAGESITIDLGKAKNDGGFCPFVYTRFGPNNAKDGVGSVVEVVFEGTTPSTIQSFGPNFFMAGVHMQYNGEIESSITLRVEGDAAPQYFDVRAWGIRRGPCGSLYQD